MQMRKRFQPALAMLAGLVLLLTSAGNGWGAFVDNGDGTVIDTDTGLMWQQADNGAGRTWRIALSTCEALELTGQTDWRLPDIRELQSIVDDRNYFPAIASVFNTRMEPYWSATTDTQTPGNAWYVQFIRGFADNSSKSDAYRVRCVRGGPAGSLYLDLTKPNGGEILVKGQPYTITWNTRNVTGAIQIDLYRGPINAPQLFRPIAAAARNTGKYQFTPSVDIPNGNDYLIRISAQSGSLQDFSRDLFTITDRPPQTANPTPWNQLLLLNN
jgi:Protein of unknown function (DUF1566)/Ser-Thr-rich glycosyl-phosphatidyl-inositol-anchored membrane family